MNFNEDNRPSRIELISDIADMALYLGTDNVEILVREYNVTGTDLVVTSGDYPVDGVLKALRVTDGEITHATVDPSFYSRYSYQDLQLVLDLVCSN